MRFLLGALSDYPLSLPEVDSASRRTNPLSRVIHPVSREGQPLASAGVLPFPYLTLLRSHVQEGRIWEARNLLEIAGDAIPQDSKLREILAPPRIRKSSERGLDRSAEFRWLKTKSSAYRGKWVALLGEDLLASADSLKDLLSQLQVLQPQLKPLIHRID